MPKANWDVDESDIDDFDRDSQYKPYAGPPVPNGVYLWLIKKLQFVAKTNNKKPQLRVGLELVPRDDRDEEQYETYFCMAFLPIAPNTAFRWVPFLDAIGVSGREFKNGTITDEEGNIKKIGKWRNDGEQYVMAELKDGTDQEGKSRKEIGTFMTADFDEEDDEEDYYEDEDPV
jgi:hypothetical protein